MGVSQYALNKAREAKAKREGKMQAKKAMHLSDVAVNQVYEYAIADVEEALGLMGFGPIRIERFRERLQFVQQSKGLHRKGDPLVVQPRNGVDIDGE